jgi:hypothetical protein
MVSPSVLPKPTHPSVAKHQKRMILVTGNKGGTGKSTFSRGLLDVYTHLGLSCRAYDSDTQNPQLFRHYDKSVGVSRIDIALRGGADVLLDDLEQSKAAVVLVDLPAGSGNSFEHYERDVQLISSASELGYRLTVVSVLSRVKDAVNALRLLMEFCGDRVDYIAVKNLHFGEADKFKRFDQSKAKAQFLTLGGVEIAMPDLFDDTYDLIDEKDLTFRHAVGEQSPLSRANRSRMHQWLKTMELESRKAGRYLGIPE